MGVHQEVMYTPHNTGTQYIYHKLNGDICGETERACTYVTSGSKS
jgi:hypothetical protein